MNARTHRTVVAWLGAFWLAWLPAIVIAQAPGILGYQGRVAVNGTNYDGTGLFRFALVNGSGTTTFWSNGAATVSVPVSKGMYAVLLGDTTVPGMATIPATVFTNTDVRLRVSFDGGNGMQVFTPDQRLGAVGYALQAAGVRSSDDIVGRRLNIGSGHGLQGTQSTIAGGSGNSAVAAYAALGGGASNSILATCDYGVIGGGFVNAIYTSTDYGVIGGGWGNVITNHGNRAVISGGEINTIEHASHSIIGCGSGNRIQWGSFLSVLGGGLYNSLTNASYSVLGGGLSNAAAGSSYAVIAGGEANTVQPGATHTALGGGSGNSVQSNSYCASLGGGRMNSIGSDAEGCVLGGGMQNRIATQAGESMLGGGGDNAIEEFAYTSTLGGGFSNNIGPYANASTLGGGYHNLILSSASYSTLGGGRDNTVMSGSGYATLGGGNLNTAGGSCSVVPGGSANAATGACSLAAGQRAKAYHDGSFVWGDKTDADVASTAMNQFIIRADGGVGIGTNRPGAAVDVQGKLNSHALRVQGGITSGGPENAVVRLINQNTSGDSMPTLRVLGQGGFADSGALCVSQNGSGNIAKFGNSSAWVSWLTNNGTWYAVAFNPTSDRNAKQAFSAVDSRDVLDRVLHLPIQTWSFKVDGGTRHIGPMAQDFHAAFQVGTDERHIATVDADGVALAAIQGLYKVVQEKETRIESLERELRQQGERHERELDAMKRQLQSLLENSERRRL